jgi:hypothetical protein
MLCRLLNNKTHSSDSSAAKCLQDNRDTAFEERKLAPGLFLWVPLMRLAIITYEFVCVEDSDYREESQSLSLIEESKFR